MVASALPSFRSRFFLLLAVVPGQTTVDDDGCTGDIISVRSGGVAALGGRRTRGNAGLIQDKTLNRVSEPFLFI
jgi:hypothetical protein